MEELLNYRLESNPDTPFTLTFRTDNRAVYEIRFQPSDYLFPDLFLSDCVFEFVLALVQIPSDGLPGTDSRIAPTVVAAIEHFLQEDVNRVITYICDSSDRRELARKRKFDQWFTAFASPQFQKQEGRIMDTDSLQFFIAAIWLKNHPLTDLISVAFGDLSDSYNTEKPT